MSKSNKIKLLSGIILLGFFVAIIFHGVMGMWFKLPYPYNTFLFSPQDSIGDFTGILFYVKDFAPFNNINGWVNYFPLAYILLFPFSLIKSQIIAYAIFATMFLSFLTYANIKNLWCVNLTKKQNVMNLLVLTFLSYPVIMAVNRGNFDMFLIILFAAFIYLFKSEKYLLSAVILAIANAIKPFTLIFLVLLLFKKRYKDALVSVIISALLVIGGFMLLKGEFIQQMAHFIINLRLFESLYVYNNSNMASIGMHGGSSLFMALKLLFARITTFPIVPVLLLVKIYHVFSIFITICTVYFVSREQLFWKQITLLTIYILLMPYVVNDYKLIFLFVPIWLFANAEEPLERNISNNSINKTVNNFDLWYVILFGLLFIPKNIIISTPLFSSVSYFSLSIILNPLIMIIIAGRIIFEQIYLNKEEKKNGN